MSILFVGLMLLSVLALVIGVIKPSVLKMPSRKRVALVFGSLIVVFFVLVAVTAPKTPAPATTTVSTAAFDVPSLVSKDFDGVTAALGIANKDNSEPTAQQLVLMNEWSKSWEKNGQELLVTYNPKTKAVIDFFITSGENTNDTKALLSSGNLKENDPAYKVEFVKALKGDGYTGVKVTPQ